MCIIIYLLLQINKKKILNTTIIYNQKFYNDDIKTVVPQ